MKTISVGTRVSSSDKKKSGTVVCCERQRLSSGEEVLTGYYVKWDDGKVELEPIDRVVEFVN